ncbi:ABC transporter ATP-binding protein [Sphingosinicella xenopeptidilytica]|uniref:ABC transporter ATP-binding protein n=1 Tax=Sphingosinicella xenopeptidilytica TaxID=364098 RepID=A0ABW3C0F5_SPHXN
MTGTPLIRAEGLTRVLAVEPPVTLIRDVSFEINRGEFVAVIGPSGCGKSSLLYLLGLLDRPTEGRLLFDGEDTTGTDGNARANLRLARFGFVFQFHFLLPEFTALENVTLPMRRLGRLGGTEIDARGRALLGAMGLEGQEHKTPDKMSGGQRQRVAIARALANDPALLLGDEPTGNLDSLNSKRVIEIFHDLAAKEGRTIICVTHDPDVAASAHRRIHMLDGRIERID